MRSRRGEVLGTYVWTLAVDAVDEQLDGSHVVAGHEHSGSFF